MKRSLALRHINRFRPKEALRLAVFAMCCAFVFAMAMFPGQLMAAKENMTANVKAGDPTLLITLGKGDVVDVDGPVSDVMVANPDLIDVVALQSNRLYVVGNALGDTNVIVLDAAGDVIKRMNVHVRVDVDVIERTLNDLFPKEKVQVNTVNDQVILRGEVSNPMVASKIRDVVYRFANSENRTYEAGDEDSIFGQVINMMTVKGEQQVMLRVKILELARTALKELGIESSLNEIGTLSDSGDGASVFVNGGTGLTQPAFATATTILDTGIEGLTPFDLTLRALEDRNLVKTLAEPTLATISGQEAGFLAGGEFPLPVVSDDDINVELQPFGVALDFVPTLISEQRISLHLRTEVSSIAPENSISIGSPVSINIPGLSIRRADTTVEIASGQTMMIAGLIQSDYVRGLAGLPGIMDTPVIGDLVKSRSFQRNETELVIMVTPVIVKPFTDNGQARKVPEQNNDPLTVSFVDNMRRVYGDNMPETGKLERVGYVIE